MKRHLEGKNPSAILPIRQRSKGERKKAKPVIAVTQSVQEVAKTEATQKNDQAAFDSVSAPSSDVAVESADAATADEAHTAEPAGEVQETPEDGKLTSAETAEMETYFVFTWVPRKVVGRSRGKPALRKAEGKNQGHHKKNKPKHQRDNKTKNKHLKPDKKQNIDPDNPFAAALMGLKVKE
mgnify:CR=1 FL=1